MEEKKNSREKLSGSEADSEEKHEQESGSFTHVKNAHAAGDGAIEKSDEPDITTENEKSGEQY